MNNYIPIIMIIGAVIFVFLIIKEKKKEKKIDETIIKIDELLNRYQDYKKRTSINIEYGRNYQYSFARIFS